ncbi:ERVV2 protein, partial [Aphelocoma coerulescens]|nr:ERVV2 protein [Aphelocoma coerulescens]
TKFHDFIRWFLPCLGVSELEKTIVNICATIVSWFERQVCISTITVLQEEVKSLSQVILQNQMALELLLASQEGVCMVSNTSCCVYVDQSGRVSTDAQ